MRISEYTVKSLAKAACGDARYTPYLSGPDLVFFFNKYGFEDVYAQGFPSRWKYAEDKIRELNGSPHLKTLIEDIVDPRRFHIGHAVLDISADDAVLKINEFLKFDSLELRKVGNFFKLFNTSGALIEAESIKKVDHEFIGEQLMKCQRKIVEEDYNGAITNARSLVEAIFIEIIERHEKQEIKNDGNLDALWSRVKKIMKLEVQKETLPDYVFQILAGIDTCLKGFAGLSNNGGDRHATKFITRKHHARLAVNLSMTIADFLVDSWNFQNHTK